MHHAFNRIACIKKKRSLFRTFIERQPVLACVFLTVAKNINLCTWQVVVLTTCLHPSCALFYRLFLRDMKKYPHYCEKVEYKTVSVFSPKSCFQWLWSFFLLLSGFISVSLASYRQVDHFSVIIPFKKCTQRYFPQESLCPDKITCYLTDQHPPEVRFIACLVSFVNSKDINLLSMKEHERWRFWRDITWARASTTSLYSSNMYRTMILIPLSIMTLISVLPHCLRLLHAAWFLFNFFNYWLVLRNEF